MSDFQKNKRYYKKIHTEKVRLNIGTFQNMFMLKLTSSNLKEDIGYITITKTLIHQLIVYHHQETPYLLQCIALQTIIRGNSETTIVLPTTPVLRPKLHLSKHYSK